jgi:hypothetical protein
MLDARRFKSDRTPNDPSAAWNALGKAAPASCNIVRHQRNRRDYAKYPAAGTKQHAAALVVDISVVNFLARPTVLVGSRADWNLLTLTIYVLGESQLSALGLLDVQGRVSRQVVRKSVDRVLA